MSQPKVFEFAKEIGMETLALMDRIREWDLPVKSHMAELSPEVIEIIREKLSESESDTKAKTTKKVAKKKVAAKKKTAKKVVVKKATKVVRKKAAEAAPEEDETAAPEVDASEEATPVATTRRVVKRKAAEPAAPAAEELEVAAAQPEEQPAKEAPEKEQLPEGVEEDRRKTPRTRMREVTMTSDGPVSGIRSEAPRTNIVGRMDLSRVQEIQKQRQGGAPGAGPRPQRTSNLRTGFVAQPDPDALFMGDFEERRGRDDKSKRRTPLGARDSVSVRERESEPPAFTAAEFRKREMVFQPKKKRGLLQREAKKTEITTPKASKRIIKVYQTIKVADLAHELGVKLPQLTKVLMQNGVMANPSMSLDFDTASLIASEFGFEAQNVHKSDVEILDEAAFGDLNAEPVPRPPIVTVMGHVDHGKTTLLDALRKTNVAQGEAGGITQHIGAYQVQSNHGLITFIDTPGHAAFTAMRARGANVTDIVILVVAADDGVMPQTVEAISHAKAAGVSIIVAVNKIDKPGANPDKIKQQLAEYELIPEEWGGDTIFCPISALKGEGLTELLDQISVMVELQELKANPKRSATGIVIESKVEKGKGNVATILVQDGTLRQGDYFVVGVVSGRVRSMTDAQGKVLKEAPPSTPVEITGLKETPRAGDRFDVVRDEKIAERVAAQRLADREKAEAIPASKMTLEDLFSKVSTGETKELPIVLKADVAGSVEAVIGMLEKIESDEVKVKIVHSAVGGISESDILLAGTAGGIVVGFNVRPDGAAQSLAKQQGVEIRTYSIVYELLDDIKKVLSGLLEPDVVEVPQGRAAVRETFSVPKIGTIAGSYVEEGKITRNSQARLVRDGRVIYEGAISSLKRFKDDAKEVAAGFECGIGIENFNDIKVGDVIEAFIREERVRELQ